MIELQSNRLLLRELKKDDASYVYEYTSIEDIVERVGMRLHKSIDVTHEYIKHENKKNETYAIELKGISKCIGTISLRKTYNDKDIDIRILSMVINPKYWGNGYGPEALKEVVRYAFEIEDVHKVIGGYYSFNSQSASVTKKLGFIYEGSLRDEYRYKNQYVDSIINSLLREDYIKLSKEWF